MSILNTNHLIALAAIAALWCAGVASAETRDEFRAKIRVGMNQDQVVAAVGKPDEVFGDSQDNRVDNYYYKNRTEDPGTGKKDRYVKVTFYDGRVEKLNFTRN